MNPETPSPTRNPPGPEIRLGARLGGGGFGEVYRAEMTTAGGLVRIVAVKLLHPDLDPRSQAVQRLRDEARLLAALRHTAILSVVDLVVLEGRVGLIAEYVDGADLEDCLEQPGFGARALLDVLERVASALHVAWTAAGPDGRPLRIVHRDIKPANVRISAHGEVKVLDFGIAKAGSSVREAKTVTDQVIGTVEYMAPERFDPSNAEDNPAADVFALGCVLYEGLAKARLYEDLSMHKIVGLACHPDRHRAWVERHVEALPSELEVFKPMLARMLATEPADRPSAREVEDWCEARKGTIPGLSLRQWSRNQGEPAAPAAASAASWDDSGPDISRPQTTLPVPPGDATTLADVLGARAPATGAADGALAFEDQGPQKPRRSNPLAIVMGVGAVLGLGTLGAVGVAGVGLLAWALIQPGGGDEATKIPRVNTEDLAAPVGEPGPATAVETPTEADPPPAPSLPSELRSTSKPATPPTARSPRVGLAPGPAADSVVEEGTINQELPPISNPQLIVEMVKGVLSTNVPKLRPCYEESLRDAPNLVGTWTLTFTVETDGRVSAPLATGQDMADPFFEECLVRKVSEWRFQKIAAPLPVKKNLRFAR